MTLPLSPPVFAIVSHLIEEVAGLHYELKDADLLAERLSVRATELELDSLLDYYYFLRYDERGPAELDALVDALVVNETYFFREVDQLEALVSTLVPTLLEHKASLRLWCAACASGEEPLTIAMLLAERGLDRRVSIVASDISARALAKARLGVYGGRALRALSTDARQRHFLEVGDGTVRVRAPVAEQVGYRRVNLFDATAVRALGTFDVIVCRNALIYFRDASVVTLVERFAERLSPAGLLLVGASESLLRFGTVFECEEHGGAFFYRKAAR